MSKSDLLIGLRELHQDLTNINIDLGETEPVDEETIDMLGTLVTDVGELVDRAKEINELKKDGEHNRVVDQIHNFEVPHPKVTQFLSQVTDLLAMMGI
jgi:hypothetical protein